MAYLDTMLQLISPLFTNVFTELLMIFQVDLVYSNHRTLFCHCGKYYILFISFLTD